MRAPISAGTWQSGLQLFAVFQAAFLGQASNATGGSAKNNGEQGSDDCRWLNIYMLVDMYASVSLSPSSSPGGARVCLAASFLRFAQSREQLPLSDPHWLDAWNVPVSELQAWEERPRTGRKRLHRNQLLIQVISEGHSFSGTAHGILARVDGVCQRRTYRLHPLDHTSSPRSAPAMLWSLSEPPDSA